MTQQVNKQLSCSFSWLLICSCLCTKGQDMTIGKTVKQNRERENLRKTWPSTIIFLFTAVQQSSKPMVQTHNLYIASQIWVWIYISSVGWSTVVTSPRVFGSCKGQSLKRWTQLFFCVPSNSDYPGISVICDIFILINACTYLCVQGLACALQREWMCQRYFSARKSCSEN